MERSFQCGPRGRDPDVVGMEDVSILIDAAVHEQGDSRPDRKDRLTLQSSLELLARLGIVGFQPRLVGETALQPFQIVSAGGDALITGALIHIRAPSGKVQFAVITNEP